MHFRNGSKLCSEGSEIGRLSYEGFSVGQGRDRAGDILDVWPELVILELRGYWNSKTRGPLAVHVYCLGLTGFQGEGGSAQE